MRLLLVEDDDNKRFRIATVLHAAFSGLQITEARSLRSAEDALEESHFDLVVLDMSMPTFDIGQDEHGGDFQALGGYELLRYMDRYRIETPVLVLTQFTTFGRGKDTVTLTQLERRLQAEHSRVYLGSVYYDTASEAWKTQLLAKVKAVRRSS